jgi:branched-chain amino acid transport system ATP-binding protein
MTVAGHLEVMELTKTFTGLTAVDAVDLEVRPGEIVGLIGPNGAGKTTIFDLLSGFAPLDGGRIKFRDVDITDWPPYKRAQFGLGRSFQDARLWPSLTVREALAAAMAQQVAITSPLPAAFGLPSVQDSERDVYEKAEELIGLLGLKAFRDKFISELSTGSRRIVDLAAILAHDPLVLLLDEPSSGIAQRETEALGPLLLRIREQTGASLLVIEHDMPLITGISDEILALETGQVLTRGEPKEVLNDPRLVAAYLGTDRAVLERSGLRTDAPKKKRAPAKKKAAPAKKVAVKKAAPVKKAAKAAGAAGPSRKSTAGRARAAKK